MSSSSTHKESRARQNFHPEAEAAISAQITVELNASYVYLAMSSFFERDNVALPGLHKFYQKMSHDVSSFQLIDLLIDWLIDRLIEYRSESMP
jgi:ferritin